MKKRFELGEARFEARVDELLLEQGWDEILAVAIKQISGLSERDVITQKSVDC